MKIFINIFILMMYLFSSICKENNSKIFNVIDNGYNKSIDCSNASVGILWVGGITVNETTNMTCVACVDNTIYTLTWYLGTNMSDPNYLLFDLDGAKKQEGLKYGLSEELDSGFLTGGWSLNGFNKEEAEKTKKKHDGKLHTVSYYLKLTNSTLLDFNFTCSLDFEYQAYVVPSQILT